MFSLNLFTINRSLSLKNSGKLSTSYTITYSGLEDLLCSFLLGMFQGFSHRSIILLRHSLCQLRAHSYSRFSLQPSSYQAYSRSISCEDIRHFPNWITYGIWSSGLRYLFWHWHYFLFQLSSHKFVFFSENALIVSILRKRWKEKNTKFSKICLKAIN